MAATEETWVNNSAPSVQDVDLNGFKNENNNLIVGSGQLLDTDDNQQTHKAVSVYAAGGDFYTDSGAANVYVLSPGGSRVAPPTYFAGMRIRFVASNANTGASTVDVAGKGVKTLTDAGPGTLSGLVEAYYDGTQFVLVSSPEVPSWTFASIVGAALGAAAPATTATATALNGRDVVVFDNDANTLQAYRQGAGTWATLGAALALGTAQGAITALNGTDVALIDEINDELRTYRFNGATWSQIGASLSVTGNITTITALNGTDIVLFENLSNEIRTYRFNGATWSQIGASLDIGGTSSATLAALNGTDIAFSGSTPDELRTYRFNGATWSQIGASLDIGGTTHTIATLSTTDVALFDNDTDELRTYRFNGATWSQIGTGVLPESVNAGLATLNGTDIALIGTEGLATYRYSFSLGVPPHSRQLTG